MNAFTDNFDKSSTLYDTSDISKIMNLFWVQTMKLLPKKIKELDDKFRYSIS